MSPRPRETSDAEILAAASRVLQRRSPVELTLADVAKEAGVVPATLIQRFGTKRELLLANCKAWTADVAGQFASVRTKHGSPLKALIEFFAGSSAFLVTPESVAYFLAYFQIDLTDPEFHAVLLAQFVIVHAEAKKLLDNAVALGELKPCDTGALARLIQQVNGGCMLDWAVYRKGPLDGWVRRSLNALLQPYRLSSKSKVKRIRPRLPARRTDDQDISRSRPTIGSRLRRSSQKGM
ncbi:MAG: helix-turn-helix domain-containing protein [Candidatus Sulfotelmatobacter sp.]